MPTMPEKTDHHVIDSAARVLNRPSLTPEQLRAALQVARANADRELERLRRVPPPPRISDRPR